VINWIEETFDVTEATARLIFSVGFIVVLALIRVAILRFVKRKIEDPAVAYRTNKVVGYSVWILGLIVLIFIWAEGGGLATYLALVSAGLTIALAEPIKDLAGWLFIVTRRPFHIGNRIEVDGHIGDVADIRAFRYSMIEIGNWVDADQSTGRLIHIPNGTVFTSPIANYSEGFEFVWHEVEMLVTFESDWEAAERIVAAALEEHAPHHQPERAQQELRETMAEYRFKFSHTAPATYVAVKDSGVLVIGRILVEVKERRRVDNALWRSILHGIAAEPSVEFAYPTVRTFLPDTLRLQRG
jgi:small-conductance mechanosensitive channel